MGGTAVELAVGLGGVASVGSGDNAVGTGDGVVRAMEAVLMG